MTASKYSSLQSPSEERRHSPHLRELDGLGRFHRVPLAPLLSENPQLLTFEREGVRWKLGGSSLGGREQALRLAATGVLLGECPERIGARIQRLRESEKLDARPLEPAEIRWMAQAGFAFGLVELQLSDRAIEIQDPGLAKELERALAAVGSSKRTPTVCVVRNLADSNFEHDPAAPFLIGQLAQHLVAEFLELHPSSYIFGIAGGLHVAAFVRTITAAHSPFPTVRGSDKRFTLVPLTLEPFDEHGLLLADALVGEFGARAAYLLGPRRVRARSFKPFGFLTDRRVEGVRTDSFVRVRQHYGDLDVAIFGCGDKKDDGWIQHSLQDLGLDPEVTPETDVCLNMLSGSGAPIPLPGDKRELLGVGLKEIRRLAASHSKLALLLTSGARKGLPLVVVTRAGCTNAIVCDQAAAKAALEELRNPGRGRRPPKTPRGNP